jgi:hypothetical protein
MAREAGKMGVVDGFDADHFTEGVREKDRVRPAQDIGGRSDGVSPRAELFH